MTEEDTTKIDYFSPYYLGSGDQPGNLITHIILKGENYIAWSRAIKISLQARRKLGFIDGTVKKPIEPTKLDDWTTVNAMLVSWILMSMEPIFVVALLFYDEAKHLWDDLEKRLCVSNGPRIQEIRGAIAACKYTKLMALWDDLLRLKPPHACSCCGCKCDIAVKYAADQAEEILHQFLIGVDDDLYSVVRTNILSQNPIPCLDRVYQVFVQEEKSRGIARGKVLADQMEVQALAVQAPLDRAKPRLDRKSEKSQVTCTNCKRVGHDVSNCFKLNGYPEWWGELKPRGGGGPLDAAAGTGSSRGRGGKIRANAVRTDVLLYDYAPVV